MTSAILNQSNRATISDVKTPFAQGSFRWVAKGHYIEGPRKGQACVSKWFKSGAVYEDSFFTKDIRAVEKAQEIIDDFNRQNIIKQTIYLNHPSVWVFTAPGEFQGQKNLVEPYINDFQRFNSNSGMAIGPEGPTWSSVMQALSHYSYHVSGGQYVLCDLQGGIVKSECELNGNAILTDPVILSRDREYGITDLGLEGISTFFGRHKCGQFCRSGWQQPTDRRIHFQASAGTTMMGLKPK